MVSQRRQHLGPVPPWQTQRRPHRRRCLGLRNIVNIVGEDIYTHIRMHICAYIRTPTLQPALTTRIHSDPHTHIRNIVNIVGEDTYTHIRIHALTYTYIRTPTYNPLSRHAYTHTRIHTYAAYTYIHAYTCIRTYVIPMLPPIFPCFTCLRLFTPPPHPTLPLLCPYFAPM